ncbi:DNA translocase FtsK [Brockia lithotrophica]|uniref:S-DNA-T family DNA segregation ATPase FtsK/SpoIIIE n=1 Tax=Brockia lithotrophica TaxID=933949 RepID=A0A660L9Y1_9BACL|nr:DNA translocase FtsK [Brockia lithotrophica]RKQ88370.1 S-DNA-T family DNA segregation ATPase FtsK/SpoIIIE [Brockia lithotrophica]
MARKKARPSWVREVRLDLLALFTIAVGVVALSGSWGAVGRALRFVFRSLAGAWGFVLPLFLIGTGLFVLVYRRRPHLLHPRFVGGLFLFLSLLLFSHLEILRDLREEGGLKLAILTTTWKRLLLDAQGVPVAIGGGMVGAALATLFVYLFGGVGAYLMDGLLFLAGLLLLLGTSLRKVWSSLREGAVRVGAFLARLTRGLALRLGGAARLVRAGLRRGSSAGTGEELPLAGDSDSMERRSLHEDVPSTAEGVYFGRAGDEPLVPDAQGGADGASHPVASSASFGGEAAPSRRSREEKRPKGKSGSGGEEAAPGILRRIREGFSWSPRSTEAPLSAEAKDLPEPSAEEGDGPRTSKPLPGSGAGGGTAVAGGAEFAVRGGGRAASFSDVPSAEGEELELPLVFPEGPVPLRYRLPPLSLLERPAPRTSRRKERPEAKAEKLLRTLESFGVQVRLVGILEGPTVTRFELQPEAGVKVSRVLSLTDDIALALAARDIRTEAPVPGKSVIGVEVPNDEVQVVSLREVLESRVFQDSPSLLTLALGKSISGEVVVADLAAMPHLLIAGATGSGKSVSLNAMILSILYKARPDEVKFLLVDPKMVELSVYNGIPHLLAPVVTDAKKASLLLRRVVEEMERRYEAFAEVGARDLDRYNALVMRGAVRGEPKPKVVVVIDELADLMMVAPAEVEASIARLAQKARAAGIHLIVATQRPSVDVITGLIKANIPSRIAFAVSSHVDSRTILDMGGAEKLVGRGDMLFLPVGASKPLRLQGCYVSDREVEEVVRFVRAQLTPVYDESLRSVEEDADEPEVEDELFEPAVRLVLETKQASVSLLQRRFAIGYSRAARLIDIMERKGIVGPYEGSRPRKVLVDDYDFGRKSPRGKAPAEGDEISFGP